LEQQLNEAREAEASLMQQVTQAEATRTHDPTVKATILEARKVQSTYQYTKHTN
jgi:hypothetical protein